MKKTSERQNKVNSGHRKKKYSFKRHVEQGSSPGIEYVERNDTIQ